jgi:hypothetical protein
LAYFETIVDLDETDASGDFGREDGGVEGGSSATMADSESSVGGICVASIWVY